MGFVPFEFCAAFQVSAANCTCEVGPSSAPVVETLAPTTGFFTKDLEALVTETLSEEEDVVDTSTPQGRAFAALLQATSPDVDIQEERDVLLQRYALDVFFYTTASRGWTEDRGWTASGPPCGTEDENGQDGWFGIGCDTERNIASIQVPNNNLSGILPSEIQAFTALRK